ncbi:hypothetical protein CXG81DRAFT_16581 [Caulochytrium protostelioides]|uniref:Aminopeptidase P N-terminal domain-containing protein n=1 Tax=Caulochytrium protostelioides TaxID=1555241 RepID=A0A4P9XEM9_9FUNG|nr:hypothetical protein CXG81DRAFT_16581 [Caulochytrium protostelioides]|eukprot:RKP04015.1 hypothetical protein CXG81DRAFT_16581 [Caulochytrium protostelioides]
MDAPAFTTAGRGGGPVPYAALAKANRARVVAQLRSLAGAAVLDDPASPTLLYLKGMPSSTRPGTDTENVIRQESHFYYMTGVEAPDYHFLYDLQQDTATLVMPTFPADYALWSGPVPTPEQVRVRYGVDHVVHVDGIAALPCLRDAATKPPCVLTLDPSVRLDHLIPGDRSYYVAPRGSPEASLLQRAIVRCRIVKSDGELELLREAARISAAAHVAVMRAVRPGQGDEGMLQALFEYECSRRGARFQAYSPIIAGGRNGSFLHYVRNDQPVPSDGAQMLLVDAACEYGMYACDITRTFPVGGTFTGDYRLVYAMTLAVQEQLIPLLRPGLYWEDFHREAMRLVVAQLLEHGLLQGGSVEELMALDLGAVFFPHGIGHPIGVDVHDVFLSTAEAASESARTSANTSVDSAASMTSVAAARDRGACPGNDPPPLLASASMPPAPPSAPVPPPASNTLGAWRLQNRKPRFRHQLQPGMVVTVEPGIYFVDLLLDNAMRDESLKPFINIDLVQRLRANVGGVRIEDCIIITESGYEVITGDVPKTIADIEALMASPSRCPRGA